MAKTFSTGNTILPPPRLTGNPEGDTASIQRWMQDLYDGLAKAANVIGTNSDLVKRVTVLEAKLAALDH